MLSHPSKELKINLTELDFSTGKLDDVARRERPDRRLEFGLFWLILIASSIPYGVLFWFHPRITVWLLLAGAMLKMAMTFLDSVMTETSHHIRFLLAGRNPFGMTGGMSLLLAAVDAILDWKEDRGSHESGRLRFWLIAVAKIVVTPLGVVLMGFEFAWDLLFGQHRLPRRIKLVRLKLSEFFSVAYFHDLVCPEKSNDIFYADLAVARLDDDPFLYQWHRLRAMVFELEHYRLDVERGEGHPDTNILLQDEWTAYQTLKRLRCEDLENTIERYYGTDAVHFPLPMPLAATLIRNARPVEHYLRMRTAMATKPPTSDAGQNFKRLLYGENEEVPEYVSWHVLRLLEDTTSWPSDCRYLTERTFRAMSQAGILDRSATSGFRWSSQFLGKFEEFLGQHCREISSDEIASIMVQRQPQLLVFDSRAFKVRK